MLTYRMDLTNFVQGARAGVRVATGGGLKTDFTEFSPDANTLGLWHLHHGGCEGEGTGLEDASGDGHPLVNHGAAAQEDGYQFVRGESDYMQASFPGQSEQSVITMEMWVRDYTAPFEEPAFLAVFRTPSGSSGLRVWVWRFEDPSASQIEVDVWTEFGSVSCLWVGVEFDALLAAAEPWHVAAVLDSYGYLTVYVNGVPVADSGETPALPAEDYDLYLGMDPDYEGLGVGAVLDEVRLSSSARYATTFPVPRLVAAGTYTGLTFDSGRPGSVWVGLPSEHLLPPGTALTWEVRAADATDGASEPQAPWQPYDGDPSSLPRGRYFQWRATLASSPNRLVSPTVQSVEAQAGEMGYDIFHAVGDAPESLDYAAPWARVGPGVVQLVTAPLDAGAAHWFGIRPVDAREVAAPVTQTEARLELDEQGTRVPDRPAGVLVLSAHPLPAASARLTWSYRTSSSGVVPQVFRIFGDGGNGQINYSTPLGEVPYRVSQPGYAWTSGPLATGVQHQLAVRAIAAGDTWDEQPAIAFVTPDAAPPGQVDSLEAEVIL